MAEKQATSDTKKQSQYIEIPIPKIPSLSLQSLKSGNYTPLLVIALIVAAFLLGMLITKVQYLEQLNTSGTPAQTTGARVGTAPAGNLTDTLVAYAKDLDLDENQFSSCLADGKYTENVTNDLQEGQEKGVTGTPAIFVNGRLITGALPFEEFKKLIDEELTGIPAEWPEGSAPGEKVEVAVGHLPVQGSENAPVTIVEFTDFQCPFCKSFFDGAYAQIKQEYVDTGKAQLAVRHFPLTTIHPNAQKTAEAAECAQEQDKFWEYHDVLFQKQDEWTNLSQT